MKSMSRVALWFLVVLAAVAVAAPRPHPAAAQPKHYVCPPCGLPCDAEDQDKPGTCPKCGMTLVDRDSVDVRAAARQKVGILIFNGVQIIDYTGPYEIFQGAGFEVYTVAETPEPILTVAGMPWCPATRSPTHRSPTCSSFRAVSWRARWEARRPWSG
jgi:hypothetical protein